MNDQKNHKQIEKMFFTWIHGNEETTGGHKVNKLAFKHKFV